ncbi:MAG: hypothetical protein HY786_03520 [Deltaproteobacteria bacterium]|nr:hypothetical protein [Deltaproteobacteria bacterium]
MVGIKRLDYIEFGSTNAYKAILNIGAGGSIYYMRYTDPKPIELIVIDYHFPKLKAA